MASKRRIGIIGAGVSGLMACKYAVERGFEPIVFEASGCIGGVWARTMSSTKLQTATFLYKFSDFPWPKDVTDLLPDHVHVLRYLTLYAKHFNLTKYIRFHSRVVGLEFVGPSEDDLMSWDSWGGTGSAFGHGAGKWHVNIEDRVHREDPNIPYHLMFEVEFVISCVGRFSGLPNIPEFPKDKGPRVFQGKVMHSMEYSALSEDEATMLTKGKRLVVVGYQKSAVDVATECARVNGAEFPCTMVFREPQWLNLDYSVWWGWSLAYMYLNRFAELMVHKPGESLLLWLIAFFLTPLVWLRSKFVESYLKSTLPLKKYNMVPKHSYEQQMSSCLFAILPHDFYKLVDDKSIILKRGHKFEFNEHGLVVIGDEDDASTSVVKADVVIFATGYRGDEKINNLFMSPKFKRMVMGSESNTLRLYRECIHPRIPQAAIVGYVESLANLFTYEMQIRWLFKFMEGDFRLPSIREMEKDAKEWERYMKCYGGRHYRRSCMGTIPIWYNDQLMKDMGCKIHRKKSVFDELFAPYVVDDYQNLT